MRKKLLSFMIVVCTALVAAGIYHTIARLDGDGTAQASLGVMGASGAMGTANRKSLAKEISLQPGHLLNIRGHDVKMVLREPELVRHESPTTIWQYRTDACVLDIYFAGDADPLLAPVAHYEIRARGKDSDDVDIQKNCVRELARKSSGPRMVDVSTLYKRN